MELTISLLLVACLAINATSLFIPRLYTDGSFAALPARLALGAALLVCAMNVLLHFFPGNSSAWMTLAVLGACALAGWKTRSLFTHAGKAGACALMFALGLLCWRLLGQIKTGALVPIEGTGIHDELWYIFTADWLRTHSLADAFPHNPAYPLSSVAGANLGTLPRIGAESLLALFSSIAGAPLEQVYPVLFAIAAVLFGFSASLGFLREADGDWAFLALALLAVALSPVALFIYGNENFATMWGLVFLGGYYWTVGHALAGDASRGNIVAAGIFLGALLATYPELLAVAVPASAVLFVLAVVRDRTAWLASAKTLSLCALVALVVAPFAVATAFKVLTTGAAAAQGPNLFYPDVFTSITPANMVLTLLAFDTEAVRRYLGEAGPLFASMVLVLALLFAPRRVWLATAGLALGSLAVLAIFWRQNYGYGGMKAIEFMALPAATLLGAAAGRVAQTGRALLSRARYSGVGSGVRLRVFAHAACVLAALGLVGLVSWERSSTFSRHGATARLSDELRGVAAARAVLPAHAVLQVGPELDPHPFLYSRWIAYLLPDVPLVYPTELQGGGYIYGLEHGYEGRKALVTHVLKARGAGAPAATAIWHNAGFEIVPAAAAPFMLGRGFHHDEGWGRWMAERAEVELRDSCARELRVRVHHRYEAVKGDDALIVAAGNVVRRFPLQGGKGEIGFAVPEGASRVELRSAAGGVAPASVGGGDGRVLSYAIEKVSLTPCARQPAQAAR